MAKKRRGQSAAFMRSINPFLKKRRSVRGSSSFMVKRRRSGRGSKNFGLKKMSGLLVGAGIYGALRERISDGIAPLTSKIPIGSIADEVVLLFAGSLVAKKTKGMLSDVGRAAAVIEASRIGVALSDGSAFSRGMSSSSSFSPVTVIT